MDQWKFYIGLAGWILVACVVAGILIGTFHPDNGCYIAHTKIGPVKRCPEVLCTSKYVGGCP